MIADGAELRVGVVGVGLMGADHAERLVARIANARLVAVADPDRARAEGLVARLADLGSGTVRVLDDPIDLVADDEVDAVVLASPGSVHPEQLQACLEHVKPVLCEKPLTMDSQSSLEVVRAERAAGRPLIQVGFMRRFDPEYVRAKAILDGGSLGRTLVLHNVHRNRSVPSPDFASEMIVRDSLVHEVDVARFLLDDEVATIQVLAPTPTSAALPGVADPQVAVFTMAGGAVVTNEVFVNSGTGYEVRCEAVAEHGSVVIGSPSSEVYVTRVSADGPGTWGGDIPGDYRERFARAYDVELQAWVDATRRGEVVGPTTWDGYAATVVCTAGMASLASGEPVPVELADPETLTTR